MSIEDYIDIFNIDDDDDDDYILDEGVAYKDIERSDKEDKCGIGFITSGKIYLSPWERNIVKCCNILLSKIYDDYIYQNQIKDIISIMKQIEYLQYLNADVLIPAFIYASFVNDKKYVYNSNTFNKFYNYVSEYVIGIEQCDLLRYVRLLFGFDNITIKYTF